MRGVMMVVGAILGHYAHGCRVEHTATHDLPTHDLTAHDPTHLFPHSTTDLVPCVFLLLSLLQWPITSQGKHGMVCLVLYTVVF